MFAGFRQAERMWSPKLSLALAAGLQVLWASWLFTGIPGRTAWASADTTLEIIVVSLTLSSIALAALWAAAGSWSWLPRVLASTALAVFVWVAQLWFWTYQVDRAGDVLVLALLTFCSLVVWCQIVAVAGFAAWWLKLRVRNLDAPRHEPSAQVRIWQLLATIGLASVLLGAGRVAAQRLPSFDWSTFSADEWGGVLLFMFADITFIVMVILTAMFAALTPRHVLVVSVAGLVLVAVLSWLAQQIMAHFDAARPQLNQILITNYAIFAWTYLSLLILRAGGWRWMTPGPMPATSG